MDFDPLRGRRKWNGNGSKERRNKYRQRTDNGLLRPFRALEWNNARKIMGEA